MTSEHPTDKLVRNLNHIARHEVRIRDVRMHMGAPQHVSAPAKLHASSHVVSFICITIIASIITG